MKKTAKDALEESVKAEETQARNRLDATDTAPPKASRKKKTRKKAARRAVPRRATDPVAADDPLLAELQLRYRRPGDEFAHGQDPLKYVGRRWVDRKRTYKSDLRD